MASCEKGKKEKKKLKKKEERKKKKKKKEEEEEALKIGHKSLTFLFVLCLTQLTAAYSTACLPWTIPITKL